MNSNKPWSWEAVIACCKLGVEAHLTFADCPICPGLSLALLHLEYFVADFIWKFEWKAMDGDEISLEEKEVFTVVMKNP
ncbi:hypothetical protein V6N11_019033 [Hibiscus sabdariffa]|uniref:Uncharacterized protein n=1 Tax=Hibiscus sabdariffa TaxID=183260 RepID=A0ABR2R1P1_9ROSI